MRNEAIINQAKPFVKWAGGKGGLLDEIGRSFPADLHQRREVVYVEPFVGGGAVLFHILQKYPNIAKAVINDINAELTCTYKAVRDDVESLIGELEEVEREYLGLDDKSRRMYYSAKREQFNSDTKTGLETAVLFIFLNRTCFNGLYRVNAKGKFNVPIGRYANPRICDADTLRADSALLQKVEIHSGDFEQTEEYAGQDAIYYLDPPYRPLTKTSAFTSYATGGFDDMEQERLRRFCDRITRCGATFVASNSDPHNVDATDNFFDSLYDKYTIKRIIAPRMISAKGNGRGSISELLITNIK